MPNLQFLPDELEALALDLSIEQEAQCYDLLLLLQKWNKAFNLTAVHQLQDMVVLHLFDSLSINADVQQYSSILDIGSGAGLPCLPLAIANPHMQFTSLDSNGKKTAFVRQAAASLNLKNLEVVHSRAELWIPEQPPQAVVCRALASLDTLVEWTKTLLDQNIPLLAMKGEYPDQELSELRSGYTVAASRKLLVPRLDAQRHLITLTNE